MFTNYQEVIMSILFFIFTHNNMVFLGLIKIFTKIEQVTFYLQKKVLVIVKKNRIIKQDQQNKKSWSTLYRPTFSR